MRIAAALVAVAVGLSCSAAAQAASIDLTQDMDARGVNPAWALSIRGNQFTLKRPGSPDVTAKAPGAAVAPPKATWVAQTTGGGPMTVSLTFSPCTLAGAQYPISAEVKVGPQTLKGCAAKTSEMPSGR